MGSPQVAMGPLEGIMFWCFVILFAICAPKISAEETMEKENEAATREAKVLPVFQVVKFPNDICAATTRNGTCYTAEECSGKGGTSDGSCASGFGVCCVFALSCGSSSSENQTYLSQSAITTLTNSPCNYQICPCSSNICRIRYDFTTFVLANAVAGTTSSGEYASKVAHTLIGAAVGDCTVDQFTISGSGVSGAPPPIICGQNTGYHMIIDSDGTNCQDISFAIGGTSSTSRSWDVKITQYACGDYDMSGWPGCLQYYPDPTGSVASFNFPTAVTTASAAAVTQAATHLQNQRYDVCFRRAAGMCIICFQPTRFGRAARLDEADQDSFGVSESEQIATTESLSTTDCTSDYIEIPNGNTAANAVKFNGDVALAAITHVDRFCGRSLSLTTSTVISEQICSGHVPFRLGVHFDDFELDGGTGADAMDALNEMSGAPGGIIGFKLQFSQVTCTAANFG